MPTLALVQLEWDPAPDQHVAALRAHVAGAVRQGAELVVLPELMLHPYFPALPGREVSHLEEDVGTGPTSHLCRALAREHKVFVVGSLYEKGRYNTAVIWGPAGELVGTCRKRHIPGSAGYAERSYFAAPDPGADPDEAFPVFTLALRSGPVRLAVPTCYDQWFPELHRIYALRGADLLVFPSAIGAEKDAPELDTSEAWQLVMRGQAVANALFVAACNRVTRGTAEPGPLGGQRFFGRSFVCGPDGAKRELGAAPGVLVAPCDLAEARKWGALFPLLRCRRPQDYALVARARL